MNQDLTQEKKDAIRGAAVKAFLEHEAIKDALKGLERRYYEEFKKAGSNDDRAQAQARARVLDDFCEQVVATVARGQAAQTTIEREEKRAAVEADRKKRYGRA